METRIGQISGQLREAFSGKNLVSPSGIESLSVQTPVIARREFLVAMCTVLAREYHAGRNRRQPSARA